MKWQKIEGYEGYYQVSNLGQIKRIGSAKGATVGRLLSPVKRRSNRSVIKPYFYLTVSLSRKSKVKIHKVADLVAAAFIGPKPRELQINHKDGNPLNNVSWNLEYMTNKENGQHAGRTGLLVCGEDHAYAKVTEEQVREIRNGAANGIALRQLARDYGLNVSTIHPMVHRKTWKHVQ